MSSAHRYGRSKYSLVLAHGASATTVAQSQNDNGLLLGVIATTPAAVDGSATMTVNILDVDGNTIYTKASLAANTTTKDMLTLGVPIVGPFQVQVVYSANQTSADRTATVVLLTDRG